MSETHETIRLVSVFTLATIARVCAGIARVCERVSCACAVQACMMRIRTQARVPVYMHATHTRV
jgi:hypothetical protein